MTQYASPIQFSIIMQLISVSCLLIASLAGIALAISLHCSEILKDVEAAKPNWSQLENCLTEIGSHILSVNTSAAIWQRTKEVYGGVDQIPNACYGRLGYVLRAIPIDDLANVSMSVVEVIEAFSRVREINNVIGLNLAQQQIIAAKIRDEWVDKRPDTYSEFDLRVMGVFVCHLEVEDIAQLHADAYMAAIEYIGKYRDCAQVHALAERAKRYDVFGPPANWTKYVVNKVGNIIYGLSKTDLQNIGEGLLAFNSYYETENKITDGMQSNATEVVHQNMTKAQKNTTDLLKS